MHGGGWGSGGVRDTWTTLALGGEGLAVGVVAEVGFTEEP